MPSYNSSVHMRGNDLSKMTYQKGCGGAHRCNGVVFIINIVQTYKNKWLFVNVMIVFQLSTDNTSLMTCKRVGWEMLGAGPNSTYSAWPPDQGVYLKKCNATTRKGQIDHEPQFITYKSRNQSL